MGRGRFFPAQRTMICFLARKNSLRSTRFDTSPTASIPSVGRRFTPLSGQRPIVNHFSRIRIFKIPVTKGQPFVRNLSGGKSKGTPYGILLIGGLTAGVSVVLYQGIAAQNESAKFRKSWEAQKIDLDRAVGEGGDIPMSVLIRRGIELGILFFPLVLFSFPSYFFGSLRQLWVKLFVWTLERSGDSRNPCLRPQSC